MLRLIVPLAYDFAEVDQFRSRISDTTASVIPLKVATLTVADIVMAAVDGRAADYLPVRKPYDWAMGKLHVPMRPEAGRSSSNQYLKEWQQELFNEYCDDNIRNNISGDGLVKAVARQLARNARDGRTAYFTFYSAAGSLDHEFWITVCDGLKRKYPAIVFINLSNDGDVFDVEDERYYRFRDIAASEVRDSTDDIRER